VPKEFETKKETIASKMKGKVRVKKKAIIIDKTEGRIDLKKDEYIILFGITSINRTPLYCSNKNYIYLLELTNNLDYIATSILGGVLDKMLLIMDDKSKPQKCQFFCKDNIIYLVYGEFPDKKGKWILEQMAKYFSELIKDQDVDNLDKMVKHQIEKKFNGIIKFILEEYMKLQDVFSDQDIPYVEDKIRIDYLGLSAKSIGVISLLLGEEIKVDLPEEFNNPDDMKEMKESILTAKIEAIAANTLGNTGAFPRWIAVKLGFQQYRFLTFKEFPNNYFLYLLLKGNLNKLDKVESQLEPYINHVVDKPFSGDLSPFNKLKLSLIDFLSKSREFI